MGTSLITDGLILMGLGIGVVFVFLTLLIFTTKLMSKICRNIGAKNGAVQAKVAVPGAAVSATGDAELAVAIAAAKREADK